jgi:hypothetical protein
MSSFTVNSPFILNNTLTQSSNSSTNFVSVNCTNFTGTNMFILHDNVPLAAGTVTSNKYTGQARVPAGLNTIRVNNDNVKPTSIIIAIVGSHDVISGSQNMTYSGLQINVNDKYFEVLGNQNAQQIANINWLVIN